MKIIGIDVGKSMGIAVMEDGVFTNRFGLKDNSLADLWNVLHEMAKDADGICTGKPNRMYNIVLNHAQYIGVIALFCESIDIPLVIINDCTARADILGKGNGMRKDLVHVRYNGDTYDISDACLFAEYLWKTQSR